jgi:transcriptional regulator with XRE-family HTH domain
VASGSMGEQIAVYRRRGLSHAALAGLVGRSESWLSQVERGLRSVDRPSVLLDLTTALHVEVEALTGRPWQYAPNGGSTPAVLEAVRGHFARYENLRPAGSVLPPGRHRLRVRAGAAHRAYQAACYGDAIADLPALLELPDAMHRVDARDRRPLLASYVSAYVVTAKLLTKLGVADLALLAADRCADAEAQGAAAYQVVAAQLVTLAGWGIVLLDPGSGRPEPAAVASGTGDQLAAAFQPQWIIAALENRCMRTPGSSAQHGPGASRQDSTTLTLRRSCRPFRPW